MDAHTFVGAECANEPAQSRIDLIYETADGYVTVAVNQDKEWEGFARAAERPDLLEDERFRHRRGQTSLQGRAPGADPVGSDRANDRGVARPPRIPRTFPAHRC